MSISSGALFAKVSVLVYRDEWVKKVELGVRTCQPSVTIIYNMTRWSTMSCLGHDILLRQHSISKQRALCHVKAPSDMPERLSNQL